jgi:hypothetical protein
MYVEPYGWTEANTRLYKMYKWTNLFCDVAYCLSLIHAVYLKRNVKKSYLLDTLVLWK